MLIVKEEGRWALYVEAIAADDIALRAISSVRVVYVSGLGNLFGQSEAPWFT